MIFHDMPRSAIAPRPVWTQTQNPARQDPARDTREELALREPAGPLDIHGETLPDAPSATSPLLEFTEGPEVSGSVPAEEPGQGAMVAEEDRLHDDALIDEPDTDMENRGPLGRLGRDGAGSMIDELQLFFQPFERHSLLSLGERIGIGTRSGTSYRATPVLGSVLITNLPSPSADSRSSITVLYTVSLGGASGSLLTLDLSDISPFSSFSISSSNSSAVFTVTIALSSSSAGEFTAASLASSGFVACGGGKYAVTGTASEAETAIQQLVFDPADDLVVFGSTSTTTFTVTASGADVADISNSSTTVISFPANGTAGDDVFTLTFALSEGTIDLLGGTDVLSLFDGPNSLTVQNVETLNGGNDTDTVVLGSSGTVTVSGIESLTASGGNDTIVMDGTAFGIASTLDGGAGTDTLSLTGGGAFDLTTLATFTGFEAVTTTGNTTLTLDDGGGLTVTLGNATNTVTGGTGADTVVLGSGTDTLDLGDGDDTVNATSTTLNAADSLTGGLDSDTLALTAAGTYDLTTLAVFTGFEAVTTTGNTTLTLDDGGGLTVTLDNATNTVTGGTGADTVVLGSGTDTLDLGDGGDTVSATSTTLNDADSLTGGLDSDTLALTVAGTYDLTTLAVFTGFEAVTTTGNTTLTLDDGGGLTVTLDNATNTVTGGTGADTVVLGSGTDTLDLGDGGDTHHAQRRG